MARCIVIVSDRYADFGRLVDQTDLVSNWGHWELPTEFPADIWVVKSETVFNYEIADKLVAYDEVCIALHPVDGTRLAVQTNNKFRIQTFSHQEKNPIWDPHAKNLVDEIWHYTKSGHSAFHDKDLLIKSIAAICDIISDRAGQFLKRSIRCLSRVYNIVLVAPASGDRDKANEIDRVIDMELGELTDLGISGDDIKRIKQWSGILVLRIHDGEALSRDDWIDQVRMLRDILLGSDDLSPGLVHGLVSNAHVHGHIGPGGGMSHAV